MGCPSGKVGPDDVHAALREENARLRKELADACQEVSQKDAEISRLQMQQATGKDEEAEAGASTERVQHFLIKDLPTAYAFVEKAKQHGVQNTDVVAQKIGNLEKEASKVKETVITYHKQVEMQSEELRAQGKKVQLQVSEVEKALDMSKWLTDDFTALMTYEFKVVPAKKIRAWAGGPLPRHQELTSMLGAGSLETIRISVRDLFVGSELLKHILVVSHRWVRSGAPDPEGKQQAIIAEHLKSHQEIDFVWLDWWCIPQGKRTTEEQHYFDKTLEHVYILFLGAQVLLLLDMQYLGRFWTSYEAWLSMRFVGEDGFSPDDGRVTIRCLGAAGVMEQSLRDTWSPLTIDQAYANLSNDDIVVTNQRDKDQQLAVLKKLEKDLPALLTLLAQVSQGELFQAFGPSTGLGKLGKGKILQNLQMPALTVTQKRDTVTISQGKGPGCAMFADPLPKNRPTCIFITYSYTQQPGFWTPAGVQYQCQDKSQVDYYCDYAFDSHSGYTGGNENGGCNNVTFPGGLKPTMGNGDTATLLFEPAKKRLLLLHHKLKKAFAFTDLDLSRPLHLHFATYIAGNAVTLRSATTAELRAAQGATLAGAVKATPIPVK